MAQSGTTVKAKIEAKIFSTPPGTAITIYPITKSTDSSYGGYEGASDVYDDYDKYSTTGVPYGFVSGDRGYKSFGLTAEGETKIAIPAGSSIKQEDRIVISTNPDTTFKVLKIQEYPFNNVNLAFILTIKQDLTVPLGDGETCDEY